MLRPKTSTGAGPTYISCSIVAALKTLVEEGEDIKKLSVRPENALEGKVVVNYITLSPQRKVPRPKQLERIPSSAAELLADPSPKEANRERVVQARVLSALHFAGLVRGIDMSRIIGAHLPSHTFWRILEEAEPANPGKENIFVFPATL